MTDTQPIRFEDLGLSEPTLRAIGELGYEEPTPIQSRTIAQMLEGVDMIAQAQTGTGKTAAFALPIIERLEAGHRARPGTGDDADTRAGDAGCRGVPLLRQISTV